MKSKVTISCLVIVLIASCIFSDDKKKVIVDAPEIQGNFLVIKTYQKDKLIEYNFILGIHSFEKIEYYPTGEIKKFEFTQFDGERKYSRFYDVNGNLTKVEGEPFTFSRTDTKPVKPYTSNFTSKDSLLIIVFAPTIPDCKTEIIEISNPGKFTKPLKINGANSGYYLLCPPLQKGIYKQVYKFNFKDEKNNFYFKKKINITIEIPEDSASLNNSKVNILK